ncbi:putative apyrase 7 [Abeliophyllum distichum]|uniref:Apyrase 7 n=1 Tax=Abeliophyllum distichum TaxID=126358 RepID=A0ABD1VWT7_9LAMI
MVFSKFAEIVSSATARLSAPKSSTLSHKSPGFLPVRDSLNGYTISSPENKTSLRPSSSLQDLSTYRRLDPEAGDLNPGIERSSSHATPPNALQNENGGLSFSKEKASSVIPSRRKKWIRVICVLLCLFVFACLSFAVQFLYSNWSQGPSKFYVVLDCGSTGTRVYLYRASVNSNKDDNLPIALKSLPEDFHRKSGSLSGRAYNRMETEPGFDKLVHNISGLRGAIKPLVRWAKKQIPKKSHKTTSLFLYATAGVRRLPSSDSEWLLNNAWLILKSSPFLCKREWVKIITGVEEAYYGWIALNYNMGVLGATPKKETFGALDLGGSSLQVTFEGKETAHDETSLKLRIGLVNHHLTAYSLSGYGLNDAFDKSVAHLLKRHPHITNADLVSGNVEIKHPCLQYGYKEQYTCSNCAFVHQEGGSPTRGKKMGKGAKAGVPVQLVGTPNWQKCNALAKIAVNLSEWSDHSPGIDCELQPCALADNLPRPLGQFYAMSGFYVVYRFFNLTPDAALDDVLDRGQEFCEKTWDVAKKSVAPQPFIEQYCFRAPYVVLLLREGLHITDRDVVIGSGSITWTLGVALLEAGKALPNRVEFHNYNIFRVKINPVLLFAILFASLFVLVCALSCIGNGVAKFFRRPYLPLFRHNSVTSTSVLNISSPFQFQHWSPINTGDGRVKTPLSPTIADTQRRPFDTGPGFSSSGIQLIESSFYSSSSSVAHSYSSGNLGQMQFDSGNVGSFWTPHRSQMRLQSRRSQSREDLNSSIGEAHTAKV